jgi:hypothetical protein
MLIVNLSASPKLFIGFSSRQILKGPFIYKSVLCDGLEVYVKVLLCPTLLAVTTLPSNSSLYNYKWWLLLESSQNSLL